MSDLAGQPGQLTFAIEIKRATTGEVERYTLTGTIIPDPQPQQEATDGGDSLDSGS